MRVSNNSIKPFEPDYLGLIGYAFFVLRHVAAEYPDAEKVDFIIERKRGVSDHIVDFHKDLPDTLAAF